MMESLLYPCMTATRMKLSLDGMWRFSFDREKTGEDKQWEKGLSEYEMMPVPGSFADLYTDKKKKGTPIPFCLICKIYILLSVIS